MAKIVTIDQKKHSVNVYDSKTGLGCETEKVVDITEDCRKASDGESVLLLFSRVTDGRIVQIDMGLRRHYYVDKLDQEMHVPRHNDTFGSTAHILGLTKQALRTIIEMHAPV